MVQHTHVHKHTVQIAWFKDRKHMFFSVDAENYLHKDHHPLLIKVLKKLRIKRMGHAGKVGGSKWASGGGYDPIVITRY